MEGLCSFLYSFTELKKLVKWQSISAGRKNPLQITLDHFRPATLWSKNSSNHRVAGRKWSRVTCKGFFRPALIQYNKNFDLQSFLMMVVLLLLLYENEDLWGTKVMYCLCSKMNSSRPSWVCCVPKHTGLIGSRSFQNYAFKGWLSLETMKLWLLVLTKTLFLMTLIIKLTLGNIFIKVNNPPGGATVTK
jgi:hypothetical protein